jgi:hypothetical protein
LIDAANADQIRTVVIGRVACKCKRRGRAITSTFGDGRARRDWSVEQHHPGIRAEVEGAVKRVDG